MPDPSPAPAPTPKAKKPTFKVNVPDSAGSEVILTRHGQPTTFEVRAGVITATTEDDQIALVATIEGASLPEQEK